MTVVFGFKSTEAAEVFRDAMREVTRKTDDGHISSTPTGHKVVCTGFNFGQESGTHRAKVSHAKAGSNVLIVFGFPNQQAAQAFECAAVESAGPNTQKVHVSQTKQGGYKVAISGISRKPPFITKEI